MLIDHTIIARQAPYEVLGQRHEVTFRDGSAVQLHPVSTPANQLPAHAGPFHTFLRAVELQPGVPPRAWLLFDLRHLLDRIDDDMLPAHAHDRPGIVFFALRARYPHAVAFLADVQERLLLGWREQAPSAAAAKQGPAGVPLIGRTGRLDWPGTTTTITL